MCWGQDLGWTLQYCSGSSQLWSNIQKLCEACKHQDGRRVNQCLENALCPHTHIPRRERWSSSPPVSATLVKGSFYGQLASPKGWYILCSSAPSFAVNLEVDTDVISSHMSRKMVRISYKSMAPSSLFSLAGAGSEKFTLPRSAAALFRLALPSWRAERLL